MTESDYKYIMYSLLSHVFFRIATRSGARVGGGGDGKQQIGGTISSF